VDVDRAWREAAVEESEFLREDDLRRMVARALEGVDRELAAGKPVTASTFRRVATETGTAAGDMIAGRAADIADVLESRARAVLPQRQETDSRLVRERWGEPLDLYYSAVLVAEGLVSAVAGRSRFPQQVALAWICARACQTALEVHALLSAGFPAGAYARSRTLYELVVTAVVIDRYGSQPEHADLAERYLLHANVEHYRQLRELGRISGEPDQPLAGDSPLNLVTAARDELVRRFGKDFGRDYGWAARLVNPLSFRQLEEKAEMGRFHYHYQTGSSLLHAGAYGLRLTSLPGRGNDPILRTGSQADRLAQPANVALRALTDVITVVICGQSSVGTINDIVTYAGFCELAIRAARRFAETEDGSGAARNPP
jgi:hypothetical protein